MRRLQGFAEARPLVLVAVGVFLYSTGPVLAQASETSGPTFSFWRLWLGVAVFGVVTAVYGRVTGRWPDRAGLGWAGKAGLFFGLHQLAFMTALKATSVVDVTLIGTLSPIVVGVVAVPLFGERPGLGFRAWSLVAMAGAAVVVVAGAGGPDGDAWGMTLALVNVGLFAGFFVSSKQAREHIDVVPFLFGVMVVAAATVSIFGVAAGEPLGGIEQRDLILAFAVAAGPGAVGHFVMTWPLRMVPANIPPVMRLTQPAIAGVLAWIFLSEGIGLSHVAGGALTLAGVAGALLATAGRRLAAGSLIEARPGEARAP